MYTNEKLDFTQFNIDLIQSTRQLSSPLLVCSERLLPRLITALSLSAAKAWKPLSHSLGLAIPKRTGVAIHLRLQAQILRDNHG